MIDDKAVPLVNRLLEYPDIKCLWNKTTAMCGGDQIVVESVTVKSDLAPFGASSSVHWNYSSEKGHDLKSPKIHYLKTLDDDSSLLFILFEICNLTYFKEYLDLDIKAQKGSLSEKKYVQLNYDIEADKVNRLYHSLVEKMYESKDLSRNVYLKPFDPEQKEKHKQKFIERYRALNEKRGWLSLIYRILFPS